MAGKVLVHQSLGLGVLAGIATALIGASWQVVSRSASFTPLGPLELAVLRYVVPALMLLPVLWRTGLLPQGVDKRLLCIMVCGGGLPFGLLVFGGSRFAPAAHMGVLVAATGPLITATLLWLTQKRKVTRWQALGLFAISVGVLLLCAGSLTSAGGSWIGDVMFLLAAVIWGGYGIAFAKSGLGAWQAAAVVNAWSAIGVGILVVVFGAPGFSLANPATLLLQVTWQSFFAGLLGLVLYMAAVRHLGAQGAAAFGALVPVLSLWGGWMILGEAVTPWNIVASCLATMGVALAVGGVEYLRALRKVA